MRKRQSNAGWLLPAVAAMAILVVAGALSFGAGDLVATRSASNLSSQPPQATPPTPLPEPLTEVARDVMSRTVTIEAVRATDERFGTGWLFDTHGDFVTNAHVIVGQLGVRIRDRAGNTHYATVLDEDDVNDIAVVRSTDGFTGTPLPTTTTEPKAGDPVVAVASGRSTGHGDVTVEKVLALNQNVPVRGNPEFDPTLIGKTTVYGDMISVGTAQIFAGNSGGPILGQDGKVFGIVTLAGKSGNRAYSIPIARVFVELNAMAQRTD